jgi:predicted acetyltransferase
LPSEQIQLEDNLILRAGTANDAERTIELNRIVHGNPEKNEPSDEVALWTADLFAGYNKAIGPSDFTIVEDTSTGEIVSTICLMSQVWNIGGIDTPMGMPEIVGTHPDYRRRGLVRKQFDLMHKWSADRGQLFNTIMGIPNYYRQFGYEYAIDAYGGSMTPLELLKQVSLKDDEQVPFTARDAERSDAQFIAEIYKNIHERGFVSVNRSPEIIEKELFECSEGSAFNWRARILEIEGTPVAVYMYGLEKMGEKGIRVDVFEIDSSVNWLDASKSMLLDLQTLGKRFISEGKIKAEMFEFSFSQSHPLYRIYKEPLGMEKKPYAWYVRVGDMPKLLNHLSPLFEKRLADSELRGWSGDVSISFYNDGVSLSFDSGKLKSVESTGYIERSDASAHYPELTFLQALFGKRSFSELRDLHNDCFAKDHAMGTLQDILFGGPLASAVLQVS